MRWIGWLVLAGWQIAAQAGEWPLPLQAGEERRSLVGNAAVLVDPTGKETIETIHALDPSRFRVFTRTFSAGYTPNQSDADASLVPDALAEATDEGSVAGRSFRRLCGNVARRYRKSGDQS